VFTKGSARKPRPTLGALAFGLALGLVLGLGVGPGWGVQLGGSRPDLAVRAIALAPEAPEAGEVVSITVVVENRGRGHVLRPFNSVQVLDRLGPRETTEVTRLWTAVEGEHPLVVRVDPFNAVEEEDERNNRAQVTVTVRPPRGVRSITLGLFEAAAAGLRDGGHALRVQTGSDFFRLLEELEAASTEAQGAFVRASRQLKALARLLPPVLRGEPQVQEGLGVAERYAAMAEAFGEAGAGLQRLDVALLIQALEALRDELAALSTIELEGTSLRGLEASLALMDRALEEARALERAAASGEDVDVEAVAQRFLGTLAEVGAIWVGTAEKILQNGSARLARFTADGRDAPVLRYSPLETLVIAVPGAKALRFELFDPEGASWAAWSSTTPASAPAPEGPQASKYSTNS